MELVVQELLGYITAEYEAWSNTGMFVAPIGRERVYDNTGSKVRAVTDGITVSSLGVLFKRAAKERKIPFVKVLRKYEMVRGKGAMFERQLTGRRLMFRRRKNLEFVIAMFAVFGIDGYQHVGRIGPKPAQPVFWTGKSQFVVHIPEELWEGVHAMLINNYEWRRVMRLDKEIDLCLPAPTCTTRSKRSTKKRSSTDTLSISG